MKNQNQEQPSNSRRSLLKTIGGASALGVAGVFSLGTPQVAFAKPRSKEERDKLTPDQVLEELEAGNKRFREGKMHRHDYLAQKRATLEEQYPSAIVLSCIDSRAPTEILFDTRIGESFVTRVAGNVSNEDILGSMEYACNVAGAKLIVVMGHTSCGAVKGAIGDVKLGNLTELLDKIKPAIDKTEFEGERVATNHAFVDKVAKTNVQLTINRIRQGSSVLSGLEKEGKIKIAGAMYNLKGGQVDFWL